MSDRDMSTRHVSFGSFDSTSKDDETDDNDPSSRSLESLKYSRVVPKKLTSTVSSRLVRFSTSNENSDKFEEADFVSSGELSDRDSLRSSSSNKSSPRSKILKDSSFDNKVDYQSMEDPPLQDVFEDDDLIDLSQATLEFPDMSSDTLEFPHSSSLRYNARGKWIGETASRNLKDEEAMQEEETRPLTSKSRFRRKTHESDAKRMVQIASAFLSDYESGRPCSLPTDDVPSLSLFQLKVYCIRYSSLWKWTKNAAMFASFLSSCWVGFETTSTLATLCTSFFVLVFAADLIFAKCIFHQKYTKQKIPNNNVDDYPNNGSKISTFWHTSLAVLLVPLFIEQLYSTIWVNPNLRTVHGVSNDRSTHVVQHWNTFQLIIRCNFPIILFFYESKKCRDALEALRKVTPIITKVIMMELFTILSFAAVACRLFSHYEEYSNLPKSFLSLFELSTTVVNPSIWMHVYNDSRKSALFFILFIVTCLFYLHSLVLSVVYQVYIQAIAETRNRTNHDKQEALNFAFLALENLSFKTQKQNQNRGFVETMYLEQTLKILRPHYGPSKIVVLLQILDPGNIGVIDFTKFRRNMPKALDTSLRSTRQHMIIFEILTAFIAVTNLIYALLCSYILEIHPVLDKMYITVGTFINILCIIDLIVRLNPYYRITSYIRFSRPLDGLAIIAVALSSYGAILHVFSHSNAGKYMLIGRAIDMVRVMRYFTTFNSIIKRTVEAAPTLIGPLSLVFSWMHLSVFLGMALWRGHVHVGNYEGKITPHYDLNNFNSYSSGLVTMFQTIVVNDWHAIAAVYLFADTNAFPLLVYTFFISANLIGVGIFNVMLAFFVGSFVTKVDRGKVEVAKDEFNDPKSTYYLSTKKVRKVKGSFGGSETSSIDSVTSSCRFHITERQGYHQILDTLLGEDVKESTDFSKKVCHVLKLFDSISGVEKVGHLICCQLTGDRFGNHRFLSMTEKYLSGDDLHAVVTKMISDLASKKVDDTALTGKDTFIQCTYQKKGKFLRITASVFPPNPDITMFVAKECDKV